MDDAGRKEINENRPGGRAGRCIFGDEWIAGVHPYFKLKQYCLLFRKQNQILVQIRYDENIHKSSLQTMRDKFEDILANFHCFDKTVRQLNINSKSVLIAFVQFRW